VKKKFFVYGIDSGVTDPSDSFGDFSTELVDPLFVEGGGVGVESDVPESVLSNFFDDRIDATISDFAFIHDSLTAVYAFVGASSGNDNEGELLSNKWERISFCWEQILPSRRKGTKSASGGFSFNKFLNEIFNFCTSSFRADNVVNAWILSINFLLECFCVG
jgi:hypothetical protein